MQGPGCSGGNGGGGPSGSAFDERAVEQLGGRGGQRPGFAFRMEGVTLPPSGGLFNLMAAYPLRACRLAQNRVPSDCRTQDTERFNGVFRFTAVTSNEDCRWVNRIGTNGCISEM